MSKQSRKIVEVKGRRIELPTAEEDAAIVAGANADPDNPIVPAERIAAMKPGRRPGQRGKQKAPTKIDTHIRLDADIVEYFKAGGEGWQTRINDALRELVEARK